MIAPAPKRAKITTESELERAKITTESELERAKITTEIELERAKIAMERPEMCKDEAKFRDFSDNNPVSERLRKQ